MERRETFFLGTAMSSMDPPPKGKHGNPNPFVSELRSDSGKTNCGDTTVLLRTLSSGDGFAME